MRAFPGRVPARRRAALATAVVGVLLLAPAGPAAARKLQMSGTWAIRNGQAFIPLQFAQSGPNFTTTSMGYLSQGCFFPNGPIAGEGAVTATGSAPATLRVPRHRFRMQPSAVWPIPGPTLVQITTMFEIDGPFEVAAFAPGGGPGSFTWCPNDEVGCPATGPPIGGDRHGRVIYRAGANRFGGAMRMGLANGGTNSFVFNAVPFQVGTSPSARAVRRCALPRSAREPHRCRLPAWSTSLPAW